jgi:lysine 2,3-aminomutase
MATQQDIDHGIRRSVDLNVSEGQYSYVRLEREEPDWRRFPGWRDVSAAEWSSAQWQRANCVMNLGELRAVLGDTVGEDIYADLDLDRRAFATMPMLLPPHMVNTMTPGAVPTSQRFRRDPVRRYMLPLAAERDPLGSSHPLAERDSLHEKEMWAVEGLTHRYPTKVLLEMVSTCPQYCGHCTRMDLVGTSTAQVTKTRFEMRPEQRYSAMLDHLRATPQIRDVVVSGGDVANVPWRALERFVNELLGIDSIRDIRLASKSLIGLPQHWLQSDVLAGMTRIAALARARGVSLSVHTHANTAQSVTPLVARATRALLDTGIRDIRNQGVLLDGVNTTSRALLDLCFALLDQAQIIPYYFYLCDVIPHVEHWRISVWRAQELQQSIMGYLPGFATPRIVCDVPYLGKRWVHQAVGYDRDLGVSSWTEGGLANKAAVDRGSGVQRFQYFDPIRTLPVSGQAWWSRSAGTGCEFDLAELDAQLAFGRGVGPVDCAFRGGRR